MKPIAIVILVCVLFPSAYASFPKTILIPDLSNAQSICPEANFSLDGLTISQPSGLFLVKFYGHTQLGIVFKTPTSKYYYPPKAPSDIRFLNHKAPAAIIEYNSQQAAYQCRYAYTDTQQHYQAIYLSSLRKDLPIPGFIPRKS